jgi:hypothetical protein
MVVSVPAKCYKLKLQMPERKLFLFESLFSKIINPDHELIRGYQQRKGVRNGRNYSRKHCMESTG